MSSVTFHAVCPPSNKRKDGTIPVKIRVTFKGLHRYLATTLIARPGDLTRSLHIKSPDINARAADLIARMQDTLADFRPQFHNLVRDLAAYPLAPPEIVRQMGVADAELVGYFPLCAYFGE